MNIATWQYVDWTHEHEWRIPGDVMLESGDFRVIVKTEEYKKRLIHEPGMKKLIKKPKNIIVFENFPNITLFVTIKRKNAEG